MGLLFNHEDEVLAETETTLTVLSVLIILYSLLVLMKGLERFRDPCYIGILMCGHAGNIPCHYQTNVARKLAVIAANAPGIAIPTVMYVIVMSFDSFLNSQLLSLVITYYTLKLVVGLLVTGYPINIGDVLAEYALTCFFAYGHSAGCCYLYDYDNLLVTPFYFIGILIFMVGLLMYVYHEYKLRNLETMFRTRIAYARGGMFNYVVAPQHLGEVVTILGLFIATGTITGAAHFMFIFCYMAVLSNMRYYDLRDRFGTDFDGSTKKMIPFIW